MREYTEKEFLGFLSHEKKRDVQVDNFIKKWRVCDGSKNY